MSKNFKITILFMLIRLFISDSALHSQTVCNSSGNIALFSNYDGGIININVDQNIPNLIIAVSTYEPVQINIIGPFASNVSQVIYSGFNSIQNNNNCSQGNFTTSVSGVNPAIVSISPPNNPPPVGYTPYHNNGSGPWGGTMVGASGQCDTITNAGGVNTPDEIVYYFTNQTGGQLLFNNTQYGCWLNQTFNISGGGNCCIVNPGTTSSVCVTPTLNLALSSNSLCANNFNGSTNTVSINASGATTYTWTGFSGVTPNTTSGPAISATAIPGSAFGMGTVTGFNGTCSTTATFSVTNLANPTVGVTSSVVCGATLTASGATNYSWSPSVSLSSSTGSTVIANPSSTTVYSIVGTSLNCNSATQTVQVSPSSFLTLALSSPTLCANNFNGSTNTVSINASGATTYIWTGFSGVTSNTTSGSVISATAIPGSAFGTGTVTGFNGTCSTTATFSVTNISNPIITVPSSVVCSPNATLTASGATNYSWSPAGSLSSPTGSSVIANPASTTVYSIIGTSLNCNSATQTVQVSPGPTLTLVLSSPTLCANNFNGSTNTVSINASGFTTYTWTGFSGVISNTTSGSVISATAIPGSAFGTGTVTGFNGTCSTTATFSVTKISNPNITVPSSVVCSPNATLTANGATNYSWSPTGSLSSSTGSSVIANPASTTVYSIIGTSLNCNSATQTVQVSPSSALTLVLSSPTLCANNFNGSTNTVSINASGATTYTWTGFSGVTPNTTSGSVISATAIPGSAFGMGTVTGFNGTCSSTTTFSVSNLTNPIINVTSSVICGSNATLTASGATNYAWSPASGLSSLTGSSVIANPASTTVYSVIGTSLNCNSATQTATVTVPVSLSVSIATSTNQICTGGTINYTATASGGIGAPYTYSWSNGATGSVVTVTANTSGTNSYSVVAQDVNSCASANAIQIVTVIPSPVLTTANAGICSGQSANLVVNGASSYSWSPSTALSSTLGSAVIANPSSTTVYSVTGTNLFCTSTASLTVSVVPYPNSNVTSPNQQICYGSSTQINATNAQGYNWAPNYAISNIIGPNVVVSPSVNTTYTVTTYNSNGTLVCSETKMMPIVVVPQVTTAISNNQSICFGNETSLAADGGNTYIWAPANSLNNASTRVVIASPSVTTIYTVDVSSNGSCGKTTTVSVKVNPNPIVFAGRDTTFNLDEPMFINANGTGTLTWVSGEGIFCKDCPETKIVATQSGCYVIETVNEFGCKASDEVCVEVTTNYGVYIPNSFTPNDDGLNDIFLVQGYSLSDVKMEIFDRWGEKLFSSNDQKLGWNGTYKGTACKNDVYVYKLSYKGLDSKRQFKTGHVSINR